MIDNYAWYSIIVRLIAEVIFVIIFAQQIRAFSFRDKADYKWLQFLLLVALFCLAFGNGFTLLSNFFRQGDGNLQEVTRHLSMIASGTAALGAAVALYLINKFKFK